MIEMLAYAFGIMYTPGPSNLLSLNAGLNSQVGPTLRFSMGVGFAMLLLFLVFGYTGSWLVNPNYQLFISCAGSLYIAYLAYTIAQASINPSLENSTEQSKAPASNLSFRTGLVIQLLNPKSYIAILPIVTVQFPAAEIAGSSILIWSLLLSILAFGAPSAYLLIGARLGKRISQPHYFRFLNLSMALLLLYVAGDIAYNDAYLKWG